jgi:hypothetical protein
MLKEASGLGARFSKIAEVHEGSIGFSNFRVETLCRPLRLDEATRKLATGILLQALRDALQVGSKASQRQMRRWNEDALEWFSSEADYPGSLRWVGEILQINIDDVREWLEKYARSDECQQRIIAERIRRVYRIASS